MERRAYRTVFVEVKCSFKFKFHALKNKYYIHFCVTRNTSKKQPVFISNLQFKLFSCFLTVKANDVLHMTTILVLTYFKYCFDMATAGTIANTIYVHTTTLAMLNFRQAV